MSKGEDSCRNCKWWKALHPHLMNDPFWKGTIYGKCRKYAPRGHALPVTDDADWCGEHEKKP